MINVLARNYFGCLMFASECSEVYQKLWQNEKKKIKRKRETVDVMVLITIVLFGLK